MSEILSIEEKEILLRSAREALAHAAANHLSGTFPNGGVFDSPAAVFVTLTMDGQLRGCIGRISADRPLGQAVWEMTKEAALRDPRFEPVTPNEVENIHIELSLLSKPTETRVEDIYIGRHGVIVEKDGRRGLLLPKVALDLDCDVPQFLSLACRKADLQSDAWKNDRVKVRTFEAEVFAE
ncbi:MAG: AmmeMemoRadiSam system protein A [Gemmatimonadota bacterium]|nr:AmmeMemoRadiSam system protein A [Gemmatimonadota bacterium]